jgi:hypothetical protein
LRLARFSHTLAGVIARLCRLVALLAAMTMLAPPPSSAKRLIDTYVPITMLREEQGPAKPWRERLPRRAATAEV